MALNFVSVLEGLRNRGDIPRSQPLSFPAMRTFESRPVSPIVAAFQAGAEGTQGIPVSRPIEENNGQSESRETPADTRDSRDVHGLPDQLNFGDVLGTVVDLGVNSVPGLGQLNQLAQMSNVVDNVFGTNVSVPTIGDIFSSPFNEVAPPPDVPEEIAKAMEALEKSGIDATDDTGNRGDFGPQAFEAFGLSFDSRGLDDVGFPDLETPTSTLADFGFDFGFGDEDVDNGLGGEGGFGDMSDMDDAEDVSGGIGSEDDGDDGPGDTSSDDEDDVSDEDDAGF